MLVHAGGTSATKMVKSHDLRLPKFNKNISIQEHKAFVFLIHLVNMTTYLAQISLQKVGTKSSYTELVVEWYDSKLFLRDPKGLDKGNFKDMEDTLYI